MLRNRSFVNKEFRLNERDYSRNRYSDIRKYRMFEEEQVFTPDPEPKYMFKQEVKYYGDTQAYKAMKFYNQKIVSLVVAYKNHSERFEEAAVRKQICKLAGTAFKTIRDFAENYNKPSYPISDMLKPFHYIVQIARDNSYMETVYQSTNWWKFIYDECFKMAHEYSKKIENSLDELKGTIQELRKSLIENPDGYEMKESLDLRYINEGKSDSGLRNDVLYSFLTKRVTPIIVSALAAKGIKAEPHKFTEKETIHRALIDIKSKGGINGMKQFAINYYDGGDVIAISNDKFMNGVKASKGFLFVSPVDNCIYGIPSTVMQSSWRGIMIDRRDPRIEHSNVAIVMDALGMRNQISLCDPDLVRQLAVENGFVITMGQSDADKFKKELDEYKALV